MSNSNYWDTQRELQRLADASKRAETIKVNNLQDLRDEIQFLIQDALETNNITKGDVVSILLAEIALIEQAMDSPGIDVLAQRRAQGIR